MKEKIEFTRLNPSPQMIAEGDCDGNCDKCEGMETCWGKDAKKIPEMKNKQEQIEEMAKDLEEAKYLAIGTVGSMNNGFGGWYGSYMYKKGYRKAIDVIEEFVKRVKETALNVCKEVDCYECKRIETSIENIAGEMEREIEQ